MEEPTQDRSQSEFNPYRCGSCGETEKLKLCSSCRLISFCSSTCQKRYWPQHRDLCRVIGTCMKVDDKSSVFDTKNYDLEGLSTAMKLMRTIALLNQSLGTLLGRELTFEERLLVTYPKYCDVCYETDPNKLSRCPECLFSSVCKTGECKNKLETKPEIHKKYCGQKRIAFLCYRGCEYEKVFTDMPPTLKFETFLEENPDGDLFTLIEKLSEKKFIRNPTNRAEMVSFATVCQFSFSATIINVLAKSGLLNPDRETLHIDVVGAKYEETYFNDDTCSLFYVFMPKLHSVKINLIGPEVTFKGTEDVNCFGKVIKIGYHKKFYEEFWTRKPVPDLIICFNCGFSEHTWKPETGKDTDWVRGLKKILYQKLPFAFTCYTNTELRDDVALLKRVMTEIKLEGKVTSIYSGNNLFKDMRPIQNFDISSNDPIFYGNQKLCVMKWKKSFNGESEFKALNDRLFKTKVD